VLSILPRSVVHPPVAHGDLLRSGLVRGDLAVIVDGYYHQSASVRHKEILALLAGGVVVVGCASMGALRAAELAEYGMVGTGTVFRMYRDGVLDADDEVAVAHGPAPDYRSFTVPLVVVRHAADLLVGLGEIDETDAASIVDLARDIHYTERSWRAIRVAAEEAGSVNLAAQARLCDFVTAHPEVADVKVMDTVDTLRKIACGELPAEQHSGDSWRSGDWRNRYIDEWQAEFTISTVDEIEVSDSAVVRYQQLYLDDFPTRWERFVLRVITGTDGADGRTDDLAARALSIATRSGLRSSMSAGRAYWLTSAEVAELTDDQALLRMLVRSYEPLRPTRDLLDDQPDLVEDATARRVVAEATVANAEIASWADKQTVDHLKPAVLRTHLAEVWRVDGSDEAAVLAAARDRGFVSIDAAITAARMFFLYKSFVTVGPERTG
jgi:hypothetical protein